jgi:hypothetical protein
MLDEQIAQKVAQKEIDFERDMVDDWNQADSQGRIKSLPREIMPETRDPHQTPPKVRPTPWHDPSVRYIKQSLSSH